MRMSIKDEITSLKADFSTFQNFLRHRITLMEVRIGEIESKISRNDISPENRMQECVRSPSDYSNLTNQELDNKTRTIIEELMWESTLSEAVLHVRETFKDHNSREKFLRCSFELVLEKDEQYRKMVGTLFGHLLNQNIVNQTNIFNSLSSVLLVIENNNDHDTSMWQNLTEILLPIITEGHIKFLQLQRKAESILKQDYYLKFIHHLHGAIDCKKKKSPCNAKNEFYVPSINPEQEVKDFKLDLPLNANCMELPNMYDLDSLTKFKPPLEPAIEVEQAPPKCYPPKCDTEFLLNNLSGATVEDAVQQLKKLPPIDFKVALEEIIDIGIHRERDQRILIGTLLAATLSQNIIDPKGLLSCYCNSVLKVERLILNQKTRSNICDAFADIILPLLSANKIKLETLSTVASVTLSEETKTIFMWIIEKMLNDKGVPTEVYMNVGSPKPVSTKLLKRFVRYMERGSRTQVEKLENSDMGTQVQEVKAKKLAEKSETREKYGAHEGDLVKNDARSEAEKTDNDRFLSMKRKKLLKERIENIGDRADASRMDDIFNVSKRTHDGDMGDAQAKAVEQQNPEGETSNTAVFKQPENLPSSAIKEKMEEIIEILMLNGNMGECVNLIKDSFNECQSDLVFKAAFEYTKDKTSQYRIQCGRLISEAFKHDPKRIGAQIMNTISLELGDYEDTQELWNGMAEIICPPMINGLIRISDLKLLPKYFLHTNHCASLLLAIFKQIFEQKGADWLEENWKKSKVDLSMFLPLDMCHKFALDNNLQFCLREEELALYEQNSGCLLNLSIPPSVLPCVSKILDLWLEAAYLGKIKWWKKSYANCLSLTPNRMHPSRIEHYQLFLLPSQLNHPNSHSWIDHECVM